MAIQRCQARSERAFELEERAKDRGGLRRPHQRLVSACCLLPTSMADLFRGFHRVAAVEKPLRDELMSIERLEQRAKSLAAMLTVTPTQRRVKPRLSPFERERSGPARCLQHARRRRPSRAAHYSAGGVAAGSFPSRHRRDSRGSAQPSSRLLSRAAAPSPAAVGRPHPDLCDGPRAHSPQRQPIGSLAARQVHEQLSVGRPLEHRRAVGLAEHLEAGAHRKSASSGRRDPRRTRLAARGRRHGGAV